jgi:hypothetical protein
VRQQSVEALQNDRDHMIFVQTVCNLRLEFS